MINGSQMCVAGGTGRRQVAVMAVKVTCRFPQRTNKRSQGYVGLFTDNVLLFLATDN